MRILSVVNWLALGGIEVQLLRALPWLRRNGIETDICCLADGPLDAEFAVQGCAIRRIPKSADCYATARRVRRLLAAADYAAVHCNLGHVSGGFALGAARAGVPIAVSIHSGTATALYGWRNKPVLRRLRAAWLSWHRSLMERHTSVFVGHSRTSLEAFSGRRLVDPARFRVILNGVAFPGNLPLKAAARRVLGLGREELVLLHVGTFREEKNHEGLLRVLENVVRRRPQAVLLLVGDGPLRAAVAQECRRRGLERHVRLEGSRNDVWPYYAAADVFVFPSTVEGFGNVLVEAQGVGLPVVASDIPAHRESVAPVQQSSLFPLPDYELAAEMVLRQADAASAGENPWVAAAEAYVRKHFSIERFAADLGQLYLDITGVGVRKAA